MTSVFCTSTRTPIDGSTSDSASTASTAWKKLASAPPWTDGIGRDSLYCAGLMLMIGGALVRQHSIRMLGDHFTYQVRVSRQGEIIKRGIYKWVRHPSYTGGMLFNMGLALALTNWRSLLLVAAGMLVMYVYRVHVEEMALLKVHKDDYREYMQDTKRFVPFIF